MTAPIDPRLLEERAAYVELLRELALCPYEEARGRLESPLAHLLYTFYRQRISTPTEVDVLSHDGVSFLFDSASAFLGEGSDRVVGVIASSRSLAPFEDLLDRLVDERRFGRPSAATLEQIDFKIKTFQNAASGSRHRDLCRAFAQVLQLTELPIPTILERILESCRSGGRFEVANLRAVARALRRACRDANSLSRPFKIVHGEAVTDDRTAPLRVMASTSFSAEGRSSLALELSGFYLASGSFRQRLAEAISDDLIERSRRFLVPLLDRESSRPRDSLAQRKARLAMDSRLLFDVGHFVPHAAGGPTRVNFFLQERRLNRGWSEQGRQYRWLENYVTARPGTVYFVRPIYDDSSDVPRYLEWGILLERTDAEGLAAALETRPDLCLLASETDRTGLGAVWLLGWFDNLPEERT